jgi:putative PIG3 family NAD(P)H quinone oxidoreductase
MSASAQRCVFVTAAGGPEVLQLRQAPVPAPGPGQLRIRIAAAGVNRHDCNQRQRGPTLAHSNVPGLEVAGVVDAIGENVQAFAAGQRVCALVDGGGYGEYVLAEEALVLPWPEGMDAAGAASQPEAAFTAWYNFFVLAALQPGEAVLIHGGTSGVGVFAIQLLAAMGHPVFVTCGSDAKCDAALALGASAAVNYRRERFDGAMAQRLGRAIDVVLDMSAGVHTEASLDALAWRGRIVHLSPGAGAQLQVPLAMVLRKEARITGSLMRPLPLPDKARVAEALRTRVWPLLGTSIRPQVAATFALDAAAQAHRAMEQADHVGKLVLRVAG